MNVDATLLINIIFVWVMIATVWAYFLAKERVESVVPVTILNFFLAFFPPFSLIALLILGMKDKQNLAKGSPEAE